jgi:hypothetical protein
MKRLLTISLLFHLLLDTAVLSQEDQNALELLSFQKQLLGSNELYIADNIRARLQKLSEYDQSIRQHPSSPFYKWLDFGQEKEGPIEQEVDMLLNFRKQHNNLMDQWISISKVQSGGQFYEPFKMESETVKKIKDKEFPEPWRFVAIHWYPAGILTEKAKDPIVYDGLGLQEKLWLDKNSDVQEYAFFDFYRKNGQLGQMSNPALLDFLKTHTGYSPSESRWNQAIQAGEYLNLKRWRRLNYYSYKVIYHAPVFPEGSLPGYIVKQVRYSPQANSSDLNQFYEHKCEIFKILISEMLNRASDQPNTEPYWQLYDFFAGTFPHISAFQLTKAEDGTWCFIEGYKGDRPAQKQFSEQSIIGAAYTLYKAVGPSPQTAERIFGPILLLQTRFDPELRANLKEADIRVGFTGYLDFYNELIAVGKTGEQ